MRWLVLWLLLTAVYLAVEATLRLTSGEGLSPGRADLLALAVIPLAQVAALRFVQWMRRSNRARPGPAPSPPTG